MRALLHRLEARWRLIVNHGDELNRSVEVENVLFSVAAGKRNMLTREECRSLAYKLGIPSKEAKELEKLKGRRSVSARNRAG